MALKANTNRDLSNLALSTVLNPTPMTATGPDVLAVIALNPDGSEPVGGTQVVGNVASGAADSGNPVKVGMKRTAAGVTPADGQRVDMQSSAAGELLVALSALGVLLTAQRNDQDQLATSTVLNKLQVLSLGAILNGSAWDRLKLPSSKHKLLTAAATNNATVVKGSAGVLMHLNVKNNAAAVRYLKLYDKATAPTVGTDTPFWSLRLDPGVALVIEFTFGLPFSAGLGYGMVTGEADSDNTAVAAGDFKNLNMAYA